MTWWNRRSAKAITALVKRIAALMAILTVLSCAGCETSTPGESGQSQSSDSSQTHEQVKKSVEQSIDGAHLRDNESLYKVYDDSGVETMYLTVSRGNSSEGTDHSWSEINQYSADDYTAMGVERYKVNGLLQVGDEQGPVSGELGFGESVPNATVQIRGQSSSKFQQKNYKIELKSGKGKWRGQRTIALNKHVNDGLRFRNKMAYDLIKGIDQMMGLRTQFVHLYVKDETSRSDSFDDYGLYTQVEQLNKTALQAHGLDKNGQLYKVNDFEFYRDEDVIKLADDPDYDQTKFEKKLEIKGDNDHTKLIAMLNDLNDYSVPMSEILGKYFDTENIAYWMAFQLLTGNIDTQNRNVYLYSPTNSDTFYLLDWDNDGMLMRKEYEIRQRADGQSWENGISNYWGNILLRRCLQTKSFRTALDKAVNDEYKYMSAGRINSMVRQYRSIVEPYVQKMPDSMHEPLTSSQYDTVADQLHSEIEQNYQTYQTGFNKPMPFYIGKPTPANGKLRLNWDVAYDFNDEDLRYAVTVSKDYAGDDVVFSQRDVVLPEAVMDMPDEGQYFIKVSVSNASGYTQDAFDHYITDGNKIY
ncbi:CotH kinase family protein, partial [Bifidobacterium longum]